MAPASPPAAPPNRIASERNRPTATPAARAAAGDSPIARSDNPAPRRYIHHQRSGMSRYTTYVNAGWSKRPGPTTGMLASTGIAQRSRGRDGQRGAVRAVERAIERAGRAEREQRHRGSRDDLIGPQADREHREHRGGQNATRQARRNAARDPAVRRAGQRAERAEEHDAFQADVDHARALDDQLRRAPRARAASPFVWPRRETRRRSKSLAPRPAPSRRRCARDRQPRSPE